MPAYRSKKGGTEVSSHKARLLLVVFLLCTLTIQAQDNIGVKYFGLSFHPLGEKDNARLMPNRLDKNAYLVLNLGGEVMYEKFVYRDILSIKVIQALYADCAERLGGFSHIGIRGTILKSGRHTLAGGLGPTLVFRRDWNDLNGYVDQKRFKSSPASGYQYLFLWYGGEFEYKYNFHGKWDAAVSFVPGYPDLMSLAVGISRKLK